LATASTPAEATHRFEYGRITMRRMIGLLTLATALVLPGSAHAAVDAYERLAARNLSPAPLVPISVPPSLRPLEQTASAFGTRRGYGLRFEGFSPSAILVVTGGEARSMRAYLRESRIFNFRKRRTRIRGHRGYLLTRRSVPGSRELAWVERGVVYTIGSGTPRSVSTKQLRAVARGLDRLEKGWIGGSGNPEDSSEGVALTTRRTISLDVSFEASCLFPGATEPTRRVGRAQVRFLRRDGNGFSFDIATHRADEQPWTGTVAGTISPSGVTVDVRATGTIEGEACDTGPLRLTLDRRLN
jgi:hypothetical protein